ncbi:MAG: hypothetical protein IKX86_03620 [Clostridia bacterium]|nr:hypothetical protein [Clostridia bacterium]
MLAWYGCFVKDIYDAYKEWYANGEVDYMPTYFQCFGVGYNFLADPEIAKGYLPSLGLGLVFAVIGALRYVINAFKQAGAQTAPEAASQPDLCAVNSQPAQFTENPQSDPFALQQDEGVTGGENGEKNG